MYNIYPIIIHNQANKLKPSEWKYSVLRTVSMDIKIPNTRKCYVF